MGNKSGQWEFASRDIYMCICTLFFLHSHNIHVAEGSNPLMMRTGLFIAIGDQVHFR